MTGSISELAAKLVIEGSLDVIAGKPGAEFPPAGGLALSNARRAELGRPPGGGTVYYAAGDAQPSLEDGVFVDYQDATTTIWFNSVESRTALKILEAALKRAYPKTKQQSDKAHPTHRGARHRSYDVPLDNERAAVVDVAYPADKGAEERFVVRITAFTKPNRI